MNRSAQACEWEEKAETGTHFACPDLECSSMFHEMGLLRRHKTRASEQIVPFPAQGHTSYHRGCLNPWRLFLPMDAFVTLRGQQTGGAHIRGRRQTLSGSREPTQDDGGEKHRVGGGEANGDMDADVRDLISQAQLNTKLSVHFESHVSDMESATCCLLFLPDEKNDIGKEMPDAGRALNELVTKYPDVE